MQDKKRSEQAERREYPLNEQKLSQRGRRPLNAKVEKSLQNVSKSSQNLEKRQKQPTSQPNADTYLKNDLWRKRFSENIKTLTEWEKEA